jgi:hypothetical protein
MDLALPQLMNRIPTYSVLRLATGTQSRCTSWRVGVVGYTAVNHRFKGYLA